MVPNHHIHRDLQSLKICICISVSVAQEKRSRMWTCTEQKPKKICTFVSSAFVPVFWCFWLCVTCWTHWGQWVLGCPKKWKGSNINIETLLSVSTSEATSSTASTWTNGCKMSTFQELRQKAIFLDWTFIFKHCAAEHVSSFISPRPILCNKLVLQLRKKPHKN